MTYTMRFDGGANPNPGPCAGAFVVYDEKENVVWEGGRFLGDGTNNIGEYMGLLRGLETCLQQGWHRVHVEGDSLLVISQVNRKWQVKQPHLQVIHGQICNLLPRFERVTFAHIRREMNSHADALSDRTLMEKGDFDVSY